MNPDGTIWIDNNGRVACTHHAGTYLESAVRNADRPVHAVETPLGSWERYSADVVHEFGLRCETCDAE